MDAPLFEVNDLKVAYRRPGHAPLMAVKGVSFTLKAGETLGIVGESGSGKSTIAKALLLLLPVAGGTVRFRGHDITRFNAAARSTYRRDVQMVFQVCILVLGVHVVALCFEHAAAVFCSFTDLGSRHLMSL